MKIASLSVISLLAFGAASAGFAETWYFDNSVSNNNSFSQTSQWWDADGAANPAAFDFDNDYVYEAFNTNNNTQAAMSGSMNFGSFTAKSNYSSTINIRNGSTFYAKTFSLETNDGSSNQSALAITGNTANFYVEGNLSALNAGYGDNLFYRNLALGTRYFSGNADGSTALKSVYVGGDVSLKNYKLQINTVNGENAVVAGSVNFGENSYLIVNALTDWNAETQTGTLSFTQTVKVGGLKSEQQGYGTIGNWAANAEGLTRVGILELAGAETYEFSGTIQNAVTLGGILGISKTGSGTQILSGQNKYTGDTAVKDGTLLMSTISADSKLILQGGKFGATGDNALTINNVEWSGGGFAFDLGGENFTLNIGTLSGDFDATLISELEFSNIKDGEFLLISLVNENAALADFDGKTASYDIGGETFDAIFEATSKGLSVSFSQVPEPAACAAILGGLALALAARKRNAR